MARRLAGPHTADEAEAMLSRLGRRGDARIRVYDAAACFWPTRCGRRTSVFPSSPLTRRPVVTPRRPALANVFSTGSVRGWPACGGRWRRSHDPCWPGHRHLERRPSRSDAGAGVRAALDRRYGADVRPTPGQRSLTLYSAVPIRHGVAVVGVALVSQSTFRILQALYEVRLRIFEIVIASFAAASSSGC